MRFTETARRLTGFSIPILGVQWQPAEAEVTVARRIITYLEDRRILYAPWNVEVPAHCVDSVLEIRQFLTDRISELDENDNDVVPHLRAMRAACRAFLTTVDDISPGDHIIVPWEGGTPGWRFNDALGSFRSIIGLHVAQLAVKFGIDVEDELASTFPGEVTPDDDETGSWRRRYRRLR